MPAYPEHLPVEDVEDDMLDADDAGEEINEDSDAPMSDGDDAAQDDDHQDQEEIQLQNDSIAHFDAHKDSIFTIAQHPKHPAVVATGAADDLVYLFDFSPAVLAPPTAAGTEREGIQPLQTLDGHTDSPNAILFTQPKGEYLVSAGLDGQLRAYRDPSGKGKSYTLLATAREVDEINFLSATPHPDHPNTFALGASDGSIWVYTVDAASSGSELSIVQAFYLHTGPATAGAWSPDGKLLCTVSEDGSFYAWDVFGDAAAAGVAGSSGSQAVVGLTQEDERFKVDGGLYSVAVAPNGAFAAVGGAEGHIRIVGLPRLSADEAGVSATAGAKGGAGAKAKAGGAKGAEASAGQAGQILASLQTQQDSVESIAFAPSPLTLMAAASVDGSIALFDTARRFATRRHIRDAHEGEAVIKVDFAVSRGAQGEGGWIMTTCGNDGVLRRWDARGANAGPAVQSLGQAATAQGMLGEWRGHRGGGEGGGVLGFVQGGGGRYVVTAGDDGVALVFDTQRPTQVGA